MVVKEEKSAQSNCILDGKAVAESIKQRLKVRVDEHVSKGLRRPGLAVILVGDNPASELYVKNKIQSCKKVGIESHLKRFDANASMKEILASIDELNKDENIDGILVQLPLPDGLDSDAVLDAVSHEKDADGLHPYNMGLLLAGKTGLRPCTPSGVIALLDEYKVPVAGKRAVVIGRSNLVGKPAAILLMQKHATVTICHSKTEELDAICRNADILVVAIGRSQMVKGSWIKPGATVIDVGIHHHKQADGTSKITGDVDFEAAKEVAGLITPVPGGVGPMTVAMLLSNTVEAYETRMNAGQR